MQFVQNVTCSLLGPTSDQHQDVRLDRKRPVISRLEHFSTITDYSFDDKIYPIEVIISLTLELIQHDQRVFGERGDENLDRFFGERIELS